jgi:hypothetical protein
MLSIARSLDQIGSVPRMGDRKAEPKKVRSHRRLRPPILITAFAALAITTVMFVGILGQPREKDESLFPEIRASGPASNSEEAAPIEPDPEPQIVPRKESVAARQAEIANRLTASSPTPAPPPATPPAGTSQNAPTPPALTQHIAPNTSKPTVDKSIPSRHGGTVAPFTVEQAPEK